MKMRGKRKLDNFYALFMTKYFVTKNIVLIYTRFTKFQFYTMNYFNSDLMKMKFRQ